MTSYKELITKDDKLFLDHAKKHIGHDWELVWSDAMEEFKRHKNPSTGKREANLVILRELQSIGMEHWRDGKDEESRHKIKPANDTMPPKRNTGKKWNGPSILDMADAKKKGS